MTQVAKFEAGKSYFGRSICDSEMKIIIKVLDRTAKTIKAETARGLKTLRIKEWNGVEFVMPWGQFSMAPAVNADRPL